MSKKLRRTRRHHGTPQHTPQSEQHESHEELPLESIFSGETFEKLMSEPRLEGARMLRRAARVIESFGHTAADTVSHWADLVDEPEQDAKVPEAPASRPRVIGAAAE